MDKAHSIYVRLKNEKYSPWMDRENLVGGQDWELEIAKAIDGCNFFLACLSKHSVNKEGYVQKELKKGLENYDRHPEGSIFLIPIRLDDCKVPERFKKIQWVDLFKADGMQDLINAIDTGCKQRGILGQCHIIENRKNNAIGPHHSNLCL
jgi:cytochrome c2